MLAFTKLLRAAAAAIGEAIEQTKAYLLVADDPGYDAVTFNMKDGSIFIRDASNPENDINEAFVDDTYTDELTGLGKGVNRWLRTWKPSSYAFTFSQSKDGYLRVPVHNLMWHSEEFDQTDIWTVNTNTIETQDGETTPGGQTSWTFAKNDGSGTGQFGGYTTYLAADEGEGAEFSAIVWAKQGTHPYLQIQLSSAGFGTNAYCNYDLSAGTKGTQGTAVTYSDISLVDDGWYRCEVRARATSGGSSNIGIFWSLPQTTSSGRAASWTSSGDNILVWRVQLHWCPMLPQYYLTSDAVSPNTSYISAPNYDWDRKGATRRHIVTGSLESRSGTVHDFSSSFWTKEFCTATSRTDSIVPGQNCYRITSSQTLPNARPRIYRTSSASISALPWWLVAVVRPVNRHVVYLQTTEDNDITGWFTLRGAGSSSVTNSGGDLIYHGIRALAGGWYKIWIGDFRTASAATQVIGLGIAEVPGMTHVNTQDVAASVDINYLRIANIETASGLTGWRLQPFPEPELIANPVQSVAATKGVDRFFAFDSGAGNVTAGFNGTLHYSIAVENPALQPSTSAYVASLYGTSSGDWFRQTMHYNSGGNDYTQHVMLSDDGVGIVTNISNDQEVYATQAEWDANPELQRWKVMSGAVGINGVNDIDVAVASGYTLDTTASLPSSNIDSFIINSISNSSHQSPRRLLQFVWLNKTNRSSTEMVNLTKSGLYSDARMESFSTVAFHTGVERTEVDQAHVSIIFDSLDFDASETQVDQAHVSIVFDSLDFDASETQVDQIHISIIHQAKSHFRFLSDGSASATWDGTTV